MHVSPDLYLVLKRAEKVSRLSGGEFDITVGLKSPSGERLERPEYCRLQRRLSMRKAWLVGKESFLTTEMRR